MKMYKRGYTQGVYDMFHVGHLNLLNHAKEHCEYLVVGVNSDRLVSSYKNKIPVINEIDRARIVKSIKGVDECIIVQTLDKVKILKEVGFDVIFIGSDWEGSKRWEETKSILEKYGVDVCFLPHTDGINSTGLRIIKNDSVDEIE